MDDSRSCVCVHRGAGSPGHSRVVGKQEFYIEPALERQFENPITPFLPHPSRVLGQNSRYTDDTQSAGSFVFPTAIYRELRCARCLVITTCSNLLSPFNCDIKPGTRPYPLYAPLSPPNT